MSFPFSNIVEATQHLKRKNNACSNLRLFSWHVQTSHLLGIFWHIHVSFFTDSVLIETNTNSHRIHGTKGIVYVSTWMVDFNSTCRYIYRSSHGSYGTPPMWCTMQRCLRSLVPLHARFLTNLKSSWLVKGIRFFLIHSRDKDGRTPNQCIHGIYMYLLCSPGILGDYNP